MDNEKTFRDGEIHAAKQTLDYIEKHKVWSGMDWHIDEYRLRCFLQRMAGEKED